MDRLYVVVRSDLPPGLQLAQACHAVLTFAQRSNARPENMIVLHVANEAELTETALRLFKLGLDPARFYEPDLDGQLTALAVHGAAAKKALQPVSLAYKAA